MKRLLENRHLQKSFLPLAFLCIFPVWFLLRRGTSPAMPLLYILIGLAVVFLVLDRIFKPWENSRAEEPEDTAPEDAGAEEK